MAVSSKTLHSVQGTKSLHRPWSSGLRLGVYGITLLFAVAALYVMIGFILHGVQVTWDDVRYGRPRTSNLAGYVGHQEAPGSPTYFVAMNLDRQIVVLEIPGGDSTQIRTINGPYLVGAEESLTPVTMQLRDVDGDGANDLLLDIRREQIIYLNRDGSFRLPTPEEQVRLATEGRL